MESKKCDGKNARGILTPKERLFLNNIPEERPLNSNERHYMSSIINKTKKALKDLDLIFREIPHKAYWLFSEGDIPSLRRPIEEVAEIMYFRNYRNTYFRRREQGTKRTTSKKDLCRNTRRQIMQIVNSALDELQNQP